jgi:hypothetical protein
MDWGISLTGAFQRVPTGEPSTKEIGQSAMDKILKENDKIKRCKRLKANKNEE